MFFDNRKGTDCLDDVVSFSPAPTAWVSLPSPPPAARRRPGRPPCRCRTSPADPGWRWGSRPRRICAWWISVWSFCGQCSPWPWNCTFVFVVLGQERRTPKVRGHTALLRKSLDKLFDYSMIPLIWFPFFYFPFIFRTSSFIVIRVSSHTWKFEMCLWNLCCGVWGEM